MGDCIMKTDRKNGLILIVCGAVLALLGGGMIVLSVLAVAEQSQYRNVGYNTPMLVLFALALITGIALLVLGLRKNGRKK
jgi:uncharacterized membrane protein YqjE